MNLVSTAERLAAIDRSTVKLDRERCLHSIDKYNQCEACYRVCPVDAIEIGKPPVLNQEACERCMACLTVCPTGAYSADDSVAALLKCAARLESGPIELCCEQNPKAEIGLPGMEAAISVQNCLAGLGSGAYLTLIALGTKEIVVRTDGCKACKWVKLEDRIKHQIATAQRLLGAYRLSDRIRMITQEEDAKLSKRPILDAHNPSISRRDLFRMASIQGQTAAARAMEGNHRTTDRRPGREQWRSVSALDYIKAPIYENKISLDGLDYAKPVIDSSCTACLSCVRACPTEALTFENKENASFKILFTPKDCIGCDVCEHVCSHDALSIDHALTFDEVFGSTEPIVLIEANFQRCERCNVLYAASDNKYCPVCTFRRQNPFGFRRPAGNTGENQERGGV